MAGADPYGAIVYRSSTYTTLNSANWYAIEFTSEVYDSGGYHSNSTNPHRITVPEFKDGYYLAIGQITWPGNATGNRISGIYKNGSVYKAKVEVKPNGTNYTTVQVTTALHMDSFDYIALKVYQTSGTGLRPVAGRARLYLSMLKMERPST